MFSLVSNVRYFMRQHPVINSSHKQQPMILRKRDGFYDPKDLERVLPVLDLRLYDGDYEA